MADETVEIDIKVKNDILPTIAELKELKRQLKETTDPEEFARLQRQIEDTTESINAAKVGAGNFFDVLGKLPGPIGFIGGQAAGLISSLKQFGQIKFSNIAQSFTELKNDFVDIAKGFGNLTGITKIYTTLNTALARSFVAVGVGETAAAAGAKAFAAALTATGIGALVVGLGLLIANWDKVTDAVTGATAETKTYDEAQIKVTESLTDFNKQLIDVDNAFKAAKEGTLSKNAALKTYNDTLGKTVGYAGSLEQAEALLAANTAAVINGIKLRTQAQVFYAKSAEAAAKAVSGEGIDPTFFESVGNYLLAGGNRLSFLVNQAKTVGTNYVSLNEQITKFSAEGDKLTAQAIENDKKLKKGLATPPNFEPTKKVTKDLAAELKRITEEDKKAFEDRMAGYNKELDDYYARKKKFQNVEIMTQAQLRAMDEAEAEEKAKKQKEIDDKRIANQMATMSKITNSTLIEIQKQTDAKQKAAEGENKLQKWLASEEKKKLDEKVDATESALDVIGALIDQNSVAGKGIAIAQAIINTYQGATKALAQGGIAGTVAAAAVIAAGFINIKKIISTKVPSAKGEGQAAGSSGGGVSTPAFSQPSIAAPQIGATANQQGQLAGIVAGALDRNNSMGQPIRAYVVGNDVTTEQQLQRRIRTAARLGG